MKLGVYGGSFDPPHLGHLRAAVSAAKQLKLDKLLLIPAGIPPHKELSGGAGSAEHRAVMTEYMAQQAALETKLPVEVSRMELSRAGKSYTADTLRELRAAYPGAELWLLMGTDMFLTFQNWHAPEEILSYARLCAFGRRESDTREQFAAQRDFLARRFPGARIETMMLPDLVEVSSTELRAALPAGGGEKYLMPQVYGYILREQLYGTNLDLKRLTIEQLRPVALSYLKAKRVRHVLGVEEEAERLAARYGADVEKARIAALLHDCTKRLEPEEHLALCEKYGVALDEVERSVPKLLHAKTGAALARAVFAVDDAVYDAILYHTTGRADMTVLEKVVYLADYIEPNRDFDGVEALRAAVYEDIDKGLEMGLAMSIEEITARGGAVHHNTLEAYDFIKAQVQGG